ncbi:hypothetical protein H0H93_016706 [Arthromyces matolae]|nr:hypothetical protein H0H93_016706 [Arthromyces matolae]
MPVEKNSKFNPCTRFHPYREESTDGRFNGQESSSNGDPADSSSPGPSIEDAPKQAPAPVSRVAAIFKLMEAVKRNASAANTCDNYMRYIIALRVYSAYLADHELGDMDADLLRINVDHPNYLSIFVLVRYITEKCLVQGRGRATAIKIISALTWQWDNVDNGRYSQKYCRIDEHGRLQGNPARHISVKKLCAGIKRRDEAVKPHQATPMTKGDLTDIVRWSQKKVAQQDVTIFIDCPLTFGLQRATLLRELRGRAVLTFGHCICARFCEIAGLKGKNIQYVEAKYPEYPYYIICFTKRKAKRRNDLELNPLTSYRIYQQTSTPESDCYTHLRTWMSSIESCLGRPLGREEHAFSFISSKGELHLDRTMSLTMVRDDINRMAENAGIEKYYTTHSLRRGGIQYYALHADDPWPLKIVYWWASWSLKENPKMLMTYIFNGTHACDEYFGDRFNPEKQKPAIVQKETAGLTIQHLQDSTDTILDTMRNHIKNLALDVNSGVSSVCNRLQSVEKGIGGLEEGLKALSMKPYQPNSPLHISASFISPMTQNPTQWTQRSLALKPAISIAQSEARDTLPGNFGSPRSRAPIGEVSINAIRIPDLPKGKGQWRMAVEQWNVVDPQTKRCLRDWPPDWVDALEGKYDVRKAIATAREKFIAEADFVKAYDADEVTITQLVAKIKEQLKGRKQSRRSKNGSPNTRAAKKAEAAAAAAKVRTRKFGDTRINTSHSSRLDCVDASPPRFCWILSRRNGLWAQTFPGQFKPLHMLQYLPSFATTRGKKRLCFVWELPNIDGWCKHLANGPRR